jgi:hypothetical protein
MAGSPAAAASGLPPDMTPNPGDGQGRSLNSLDGHGRSGADPLHRQSIARRCPGPSTDEDSGSVNRVGAAKAVGLVHPLSPRTRPKLSDLNFTAVLVEAGEGFSWGLQAPRLSASRSTPFVVLHLDPTAARVGPDLRGTSTGPFGELSRWRP